MILFVGQIKLSNNNVYFMKPTDNIANEQA